MWLRVSKYTNESVRNAQLKFIKPMNIFWIDKKKICFCCLAQFCLLFVLTNAFEWSIVSVHSVTFNIEMTEPNDVLFHNSGQRHIRRIETINVPLSTTMMQQMIKNVLKEEYFAGYCLFALFADAVKLCLLSNRLLFI